MQSAAVFSCQGLGDGLISLVLANNLSLNGVAVCTYHPFLEKLQAWFPHLPMHSFEKADLEQFDHLFFFLERSLWMQPLLKEALEKHRYKTTVLNPIATTHCDYPHWEEGRFQGDKTLVENLYQFAARELKYNVYTKSNGITPLPGLSSRLHAKRVLLHPTSSREGKNWPQAKYMALQQELQNRGFEPRFLLTAQEKQNWQIEDTLAPVFHSLSEVAGYVYESGYLIGNDSGMGHLASCLSVPTLTICRSGATARFWRPGWAPGKVIYPSHWIPNLKGLRLRDEYWKQWISVGRVLTDFDQLCKLTD